MRQYTLQIAQEAFKTLFANTKTGINDPSVRQGGLDHKGKGHGRHRSFYCFEIGTFDEDEGYWAVDEENEDLEGLFPRTLQFDCMWWTIINIRSSKDTAYRTYWPTPVRLAGSSSGPGDGAIGSIAAMCSSRYSMANGACKALQNKTRRTADSSHSPATLIKPGEHSP